MGTDSDSGSGISAAASGSDIQDISVATRTGRIAVSWTQKNAQGIRHVYVKESTGAAWQEVIGSSSGNGISGAISASFQGPMTNNAKPSIAYLGSDMFAAWQTYADQYSAVIAVQIPSVVGSSIAVKNISPTIERNAQPSLASGGSEMQLAWLNGQTLLYSLRWNGTSFVEAVPGDATGVGITNTGRNATSLALTIDSTGKPTAVWQDNSNSGRSAIMARSNALPNGTFYAASSSGQTIQQILDANVLAAGDVIVVNGNLTGNVVISTADSGVTIIGAPGSLITGNISVSGNNVSLQRLNVTGNVTLAGGDRNTLRESNVIGSVAINGGTRHQLSYNTVTTGGVAIGIGADALMVRNNRITGGTNGIAIGVVTNISLRDNTLSGAATGIRISQASTGEITGNKVSATGLLWSWMQHLSV